MKGWPEITPPTVPPIAPPTFTDSRHLDSRGTLTAAVRDVCPDCAHETAAHPSVGQQDFTRCAECTWEESIDRRDEANKCARRFPSHSAS
jgi:hypothetical protein